MIRYGFACKTLGVPYTEQTSLTLARADLAHLLKVSRHNLLALGRMLHYCHNAHIPLMRISSEVIPLASHPQVAFDWRHHLQAELKAARDMLQDTGLRVSMHPGQYTILNSPREEVVKRAVADLLFHADFLDALGADHTARIVLHLGGAYGDQRSALERLSKNLKKLPQRVRGRLALENDERLYTIEEVLKVCRRFSLPAIMDVFHHALNPPSHGSLTWWLEEAGSTWTPDTGRQKIHYSQQLAGGRPGMHSRSIAMGEFLAFHHMLGTRELDVMLEVKDKNLSAVKCINLTTPDVPRSRLTDEWARYKYLILEHNPAAYSAIRTLLQTHAPSVQTFYSHLENALEEEVTPGHARNAAQHVWGYVDKLASPAEAKRIRADIDALDDDLKTLPRLKHRLFALARRHGISYLENSAYFYL